jgi:ligand-binding SRPBCC domain-containing protein
MKILKTEQYLPVSLEEAWQFFASPANLDKITPPEMVFSILSQVPEKMYPGLFITYTVTPFFHIPLQWVTEITHIREPFYFVDEQRLGPYRLWHHEHHFREVPGGVIISDMLHYHVGFGLFGRIAEKLFVDRKVKEIFQFRESRLNELFSQP